MNLSDSLRGRRAVRMVNQPEYTARMNEIVSADPVMPQVREHFPGLTKQLFRLYQMGELPGVIDFMVEPEYGHIVRMSYQDGSHRIIRSNDLGVNPGASRDLSSDKGHTKFMLRKIGVACPRGEEFLLPWWADAIRRDQQEKGNAHLRTIDQADAYIQEQLGYPVYVKPVNGSRGSSIHVVETPEDLATIMKVYNSDRVRVAVIEEEIKLPDFRLVIFDGELVSTNRRIPLSVTGTGFTSVRTLLAEAQDVFEQEGRRVHIDNDDPRLIRCLAKQSLNLDDIVPANLVVRLLPISNLSSGGRSEDVKHLIHERWSALAIFVAKSFGLRLCGVDLACADITDPEAQYSVLEVNSAPGMGHFAAQGEAQRAIADDLYRRAVGQSPRASVGGNDSF